MNDKLIEEDYINIPLEEYKELLIIKGRYLELVNQSNHNVTFSNDYDLNNPMCCNTFTKSKSTKTILNRIEMY